MYFQGIIWFITGVFISSCSEETFTREFCLQSEYDNNVPAAKIHKAVSISSTSVFVRWTITGAVTGINLEYIGPTLSGTKNIRLPGEDRSYEIKDLLPFTNYSVTITPVCRFEEGMSSNGKPDRKTLRTLSGVPSVPTEIEVLSVLRNNVRIIWKKPSETRGEIAGYCVDYTTDPPGRDGNTTCTESNEPRITLSGLLPGQKYHVTVYAFNYNEETDEKIYGNHSKASFTTKVEASDEPQNLEAITVESRKIVLRWDAPGHRNKNMIVYNVTCKSEESRKTYIRSATSITLHDLTPWTEYYIEVKGIVQVNEKEFPGPAAAIIILTDKDGPSQPQDFKTTFINSSAVSLEWDAPSQPNGDHIVYLLKYRSGANDPEEQTRTERTHATINNLKCNTKYIFQLAAYNTLRNGTEIIGTNITLNVTTDTQANEVNPTSSTTPVPLETTKQLSRTRMTKSERYLYAYCCGKVIKAVINLKDSPGASHQNENISYKVVFMKDGSTENSYIINEQIKCKVCNGSESSSATCTVKASKQLNVSDICESSSDSERVLRANISTQDGEHMIEIENSKVHVIRKDDKQDSRLLQILVISCFMFVTGSILVLFLQTFVRYSKEKKKFKMLMERLQEEFGYEII